MAGDIDIKCFFLCVQSDLDLCHPKMPPSLTRAL